MPKVGGGEGKPACPRASHLDAASGAPVGRVPVSPSSQPPAGSWQLPRPALLSPGQCKKMGTRSSSEPWTEGGWGAAAAHGCSAHFPGPQVDRCFNTWDTLRSTHPPKSKAVFSHVRGAMTWHCQPVSWGAGKPPALAAALHEPGRSASEPEGGPSAPRPWRQRGKVGQSPSPTWRS